MVTVGRTVSTAAGYQVIEYPHIRRQHIYDDAASTVKVIDVKVAPNLTVGYIMGVGDDVPSAVEQLGAKLEMIGAGRSRVGQSLALRRDHHRRARIRAARRSSREQQPADRLRPERRHAHRAIQQAGIQPGAVRAVSRSSGPRARDGREPRRSRCSRRTDPVFNSAEQDRRLGLERLGAGARHSISSASATPAIGIWCSSRIRFR